MNWFRSSLRSCACIALFALALQLVVSFGHMHRDDLGLLAPLIAQTQILPEPTGLPTGSTDQRQHPGPDHCCPICASMALLGTGAPASAPCLTASLLVVPFFLPERPSYDLLPKPILSFQARGPPVG
jgi:hypothetical protein